MGRGVPPHRGETRSLTGPALTSTALVLLLSLGICLGCSEVDQARLRARFGDTEAQLELSERFATGDGVPDAWLMSWRGTAELR